MSATFQDQLNITGPATLHIGVYAHKPSMTATVLQDLRVGQFAKIRADSKEDLDAYCVALKKELGAQKNSFEYNYLGRPENQSSFKIDVRRTV